MSSAADSATAASTAADLETVSQLFPDMSPSDQAEFVRVNDLVRKHCGKPIIDVKTLEMVRAMKQNPAAYSTVLPDLPTGATEGIIDIFNFDEYGNPKVTYVYPEAEPILLIGNDA